MSHSAHDADDGPLLPVEPIQTIIAPVARFLHVESASGVLLLACTLVALGLANSPWAGAYLGFWETETGIFVGGWHLEHSIRHWINDGLMAIFFFVIGLEVKRELVLGELRDVRRAALPLVAALGGMVAPAAIYLALQPGGTAVRGWGVPMATDIAFVVGCMAILGRRVPASLRVMLLSLAIADDVGAILVIAIGYTAHVTFAWLLAGTLGIGLVLVMQRLGVRSIGAYTLLGALIWLAFLESGVHATIAGVIIGLLTPATPYLAETAGADLLGRASRVFHGGGWSTLPRRAARIVTFRTATRETISPLEYLEYVLHPWVAFFIMPLFALANAGVPISAADVASPVALAVAAGLVVGKPLGIVLASWLAVTLRLAGLPAGVGWRHVVGGGMLAGIGFTMALFIAELALADPMLRAAKVGVLAGSAVSAVLGMAMLALSGRPAETDEPPVAAGH